MRGLVAQIATQYKSALEVFSRSRIFFALLCLSLMLGCTSVRTPMKPGSSSAIQSDEGLVLGRILVTGSHGEPLVSPYRPFRSPFHIQWRIKEEAIGREFVIDPLPREGPFMLKLPPGSYQLTAFSFDTALGIWRAYIPAAFQVKPRECTYLGTWELQTSAGVSDKFFAGFFDGTIRRHVLDQHSLAEKDFQSFVDDRFDIPMVTELSASVEGPLVFTFRTQGTDLTSPP